MSSVLKSASVGQLSEPSAATFLRNQWYVAASSEEIADKPVARMICNEALVFFRGSSGHVGALEDRCPHRKAPLSLGVVVGDEIQCGYHGARFSATGACLRIPSQSELPIPSMFNARSYRVVERYNFIFIWLGSPDTANEDLIPDWSRNTAPGWVAALGYHYVKGNYELVTDNLLDLSHTTYVHKTTLAGPGVDETPMELSVDGDVIRTGRTIRNVDPVPLHRAVMGITGKIDRWQWSDFMAPSHIVVILGVEPAGTTSTINTPLFIVMNSATPETERTTHYFWSVSRCRQVEDEEMTRKFKQMVALAFDEDKAMIEGQQRMIDSDLSGRPLAVFRGDRGGTAARRVVARKLKDEAAGTTSVSPPGTALTQRIVEPASAITAL